MHTKGDGLIIKETEYMHEKKSPNVTVKLSHTHAQTHQNIWHGILRQTDHMASLAMHNAFCCVPLRAKGTVAVQMSCQSASFTFNSVICLNLTETQRRCSLSSHLLTLRENIIRTEYMK